MFETKKRKIIIICIFVLIVICFLCFFVGYKNFKEPKLGSFFIEDLKEKKEGIFLAITPSLHATSYEVKIINEEDSVYEIESDTTDIYLKNFTANYGEKLKIEVISKNKNGTKKSSENTFEYVWTHASFRKDNLRYCNNKDLELFLDGYQKNTSYHLELEYLNQVIYEEKIKTDEIIVPYQKLKGYAGRITAKLYTEEHVLVNSYNFYVNTPVVGKVKLIFPNDNFQTRWDDIHFSFEGGENATAYQLRIFEEGIYKNFVSIPINQKEYTLSSDLLNENKNYYFELKALYMDYEEISEKDGINIFVGEKENTNPVYVSHNPDFIKKGTIITLGTRTKDATIYYTLDGSDPNEESNVYKKPLIINENTILKAKAMSKNRYDSEVNTYDFQIGTKDLVVYLSPSNQSWNYGNQDAGYRTEMVEMNRLADIIERELKNKGVTVYRNNRNNKDINTYISESNYRKVDFHFAIHSNASSNAEAQGIEIYVDKQTSKALSIATNIYQNLYEIYPYKNGASTDRGVKFADGALGEVNDSFLPCGTLIEIAYHDNYQDAKWILDHFETIGKNIAESILKFYN